MEETNFPNLVVTAKAENTLAVIPAEKAVVIPDYIPVPAEQDKSGYKTVINPGFLTEEKVIDLTQIPVPEAAKYYLEHPKYETKIDVDKIELPLIFEIMAFIVFMYSVFSVRRNKAFEYIHRFIITKIKYAMGFIKENADVRSLYQLYEEYPWKTPSNMNCFQFALRLFLQDRGIYRKASFYDDTWVINEMYNVADDRRSGTDRVTALHFGKIKNNDSKDPIRLYMDYLFVATGLSVEGKIVHSFRHLVEFANALGDISVLDAAHEDVEKYIKELINNNEKHDKVSDVFNFYKFLQFKKLIDVSPINKIDIPKNKEYEHQDRSVPDTVIIQIFNCLPKLEVWAMVVFLCIFCTGMRVAEALSLPRNCLEKVRDKYYIRWFVRKNKSIPRRPIPSELAEVLSTYIEETSDSKSEFLFPSRLQITQPVTRKKFAQTMQKFMEDNNIRMPNGDIYVFRAHDWRHTFAGKLKEFGINIYYIQHGMNHIKTEMTLHYVDNNNKIASAKNRNFFDNTGKISPLMSVPRITDDESISEWMEKHGNSIMVQDGFCDRSCRFGKCTRNDGEMCITCQYYRTSVQDLPAHEERVRLLEKARVIAVDKGCDVNIAKIDRELGIRKKIIEALKKETEKSDE